MKTLFVLTGLAAISAATAQLSLCDKYTTALFGIDNAANQEKLLIKVVNTAVIGNYTAGALNAVPGIFALPATFQGQKVNLLQYFNGHLQSSNRGGDCGVSINFLDGGGATPLMDDKPANCGSCKQKALLERLYKFFAVLLGCSIYGKTQDVFSGSHNTYSIHKYMALSAPEVGYFIQQVGLSASSFGVTDSDVAAIKSLLTTHFGQRCLPRASEPDSSSKPMKQSICSDCNCPLADNANCSIYGPVVEPKVEGATTCSAPKTCPA